MPGGDLEVEIILHLFSIPLARSEERLLLVVQLYII